MSILANLKPFSVVVVAVVIVDVVSAVVVVEVVSVGVVVVVAVDVTSVVVGVVKDKVQLALPVLQPLHSLNGSIRCFKRKHSRLSVR